MDEKLKFIARYLEGEKIAPHRLKSLLDQQLAFLTDIKIGDPASSFKRFGQLELTTAT